MKDTHNFFKKEKNRKKLNKKILFFTMGNKELASTRTRVYEYLPYLRKSGFDYLIISYTAAWYCRLFTRGKDYILFRLFNKFYSCLSVLRLIFQAKNFDVIFIQRVLFRKTIFRIIRNLNPNIIFDFDDAIYLTNTNCNSGNNRDKFLSRFNYIVKHSKHVITTQSEFNRSIAMKINKDITSLTTPINTNRYFPSKTKIIKERVIGWIGSPATTRYLYGLRDVFRTVVKKYPNVKIELIGAERFKIEGINLIFKEWDIKTEVEDLQNFDIGIMPLEDDDWSRNKYYKLLQYFSMGIPAVVSSVGVCKSMIEDGVNAFLIRDEKDWIEKLSSLIENDELRSKIGMHARKTAESFYSYEVTSPILIGVFNDLIERRRT